MTISSRTPDGSPNYCPICRAEIVIVPSQQAGDAPCPSCGTLLWFHQGVDETSCCPAKLVAPIREGLLKLLARQHGVDRDQVSNDTAFVDDLGADSLDTVELVMELEEEFDIPLADEEAEGIRTVADAIHLLARSRQT